MSQQFLIVIDDFFVLVGVDVLEKLDSSGEGSADLVHFFMEFVDKLLVGIS